MTTARGTSALLAGLFLAYILINGIVRDYAPGTLLGLILGAAWLHWSLSGDDE
ncbi:hypothetical protein [Bowdeniella massiliensis]|uniref:hypothetical protein n=1 Tax=Bowdeniella massiliensis TaxID=2932264 RepID=UPI002028DEF2|nr:hypothetical protein [Bowdeniella massiliensis]